MIKAIKTKKIILLSNRRLEDDNLLDLFSIVLISKKEKERKKESDSDDVLYDAEVSDFQVLVIK